MLVFDLRACFCKTTEILEIFLLLAKHSMRIYLIHHVTPNKVGAVRSEVSYMARSLLKVRFSRFDRKATFLPSLALLLQVVIILSTLSSFSIFI